MGKITMKNIYNISIKEQIKKITNSIEKHKHIRKLKIRYYTKNGKNI